VLELHELHPSGPGHGAGVALDGGDELLDEVEVLLAAGEDEQAVGGVGDDAEGVHGALDAASAAGRVDPLAHELLELGGEGRDIGAGDGQHMQADGVVGVVGVEGLEQPLDDLEGPLAGGEDERVGAGVGGDDELVFGPQHAGLLALGEDIAEHAGDAVGGGVAEREEADGVARRGQLDIERGDQLADDRDVRGCADDDQRVGVGLGLDDEAGEGDEEVGLDALCGVGGVAALLEDAEAGDLALQAVGLGCGSGALDDDALDDVGDGAGVGVLEGD
jgi:hypothetical protein